nr:unnamed protein product [Callosobruchus analis]
MMFRKGIDPKVFRAIQHVDMEELSKCTDEEIRPVLPCLVRMGLISPLDTSKKCTDMKINILTIVSGMELVNSIVALLSIDFHKLEIDVKREQQLRQKGNTIQNDSILIGNLSNTNMALEYERSDMTRRLSILLGELLYIQSQIQENPESTSEQESYIKSSDLFDNDIFAEELADIICIALAELPTTLVISNIIETLLHVHNGPAIICRVVANFPDCFREVSTYLIQTGEKQEENISSTIRAATISLLCKMNPSQALTIRSKCVELCRMPALTITLTLEHINKARQTAEDSDMVAFVSGLLLGNDQAIRNWIALFIRTGQKRKGEVSSNALQQLREELLRHLQIIIEASPEGQLPDRLVVQASALLRLYCALRGIAAIKFQDEEVSQIIQLLTSHPNPTPAGVRFVSIGLCMLIACPSLISATEHERRSIEWVQWLVKEEAYFESASGITASFGEMLLLMAIHFHSNQLSAICDLVCSTLGMKIVIRHNNMTRMKQVFTQEIFTEQVVTAHAVKVPVTAGLSANMTGFLPIHCIHQLLKSRAFAKHNVNIKSWIYKQICTSTSPLHPVLRMLIEVYVNSIILPNAKNSEHTNKPLTENEIRRVFQSSVFGHYFNQKQSVFTMDFDLSSENHDVIVDSSSLTPQLLLLYYLLLYEDVRLNNAHALASSGRKIKRYTPEFMSELPIKYLLHHAQKDQSSYSGLFGPLLKLLATHFPHLTLVEDWLDDMSFHTEHKPVHVSQMDVVEAFADIEKEPGKCARLLKALLAWDPIDVWPHVEIFAQHARSFLGDDVSRYLQDLYRDLWFRLNTVLPRRLWVLTVKNLVDDFSSLSRIDVAEDPLQIYKQELGRFLEDHASISKPDDFWKFYEKYTTLQAVKKSDIDRNKLLNLTFAESYQILYDKLPVLDKRGEKVRISYQRFVNFLLTVKVYQDFQQKSSFAKIKKLKLSQNELPISQYKDEIIERLNSHRVLLIAGDTGCGKSTQVPQCVMEAGYNKIVCTQPRRIACVSLSKRVAYETLTEYQNTVGYQIRFEKTKRADTKIIFMTEGLLLRQASEEETLNSYDVIILDEVHERHLYGDFLVATINIELFSNYFAAEDVQVIQVPGRLYPIEIQYRPIIKDPFERKREKIDCTPYLQIIQMIDEKYLPQQKGDVLIFLNGFSEISTLADAIKDYSEIKKNWIVLPLHSSLSLEDQDKVFDYPPEGVRKCIISTNIAETSVTIDGIRFVIDSGKVNRMSYNTNLGVNKLSECNISQDSAKQRAGRAGRTGPGTCFRLYSEEDLASFDAFTPAEIHLVPLDSLLLHMISLGLDNISNFPFIEKPADKSLEEGIEKLKFQGALELSAEGLHLTPLGEALSQLPVDLSVGKMLIMSTVFGNVNSVLALASLLSVQSPLTQNAYRNCEAQDLRKQLESNHGDPISLLNYFKEWLLIKQSSRPVQNHSRYKSENSKTWARKRCLEEQRFYETTKLLEQFRDVLNDANLLPKITDTELSSRERSIRHGELKQLKSLRYQLKNESRSKSRKQLKYEMFNVEDEGEGDKTDIRDVELQKLLNETSTDSYKELMMLKIILTSGFYPQIAVEDEFNSSKTVSEKLYHTKNKNYVFLRPMSYFATNSEILELHNDDIEVPPPGYFSKKPISKKHQILVYQSILETKKVYLVNTMRMPALQTLMLFGKTIATNATLTKFVFDDFLMTDIPYFGQGKTLILKAIALRKKWKTKLEAKLKDPSLCNSKSQDEENFYFIEDLVNFMQTDVSYNIKRLLPADLKEIYTKTHRSLKPTN